MSALVGVASSSPPDEPWKLSADELMQAYGRGTLSPVEALRSIEERMLAINPELNAITTWDGVGAMKAAQASEQRWQMRRPESPLDGIPVVVDDCLAVRDLPCRWGSLVRSGESAAHDTQAVERLRQAGAIIIGKGVTSELGLRGDACNRIDGPTLNPWDRRVVVDGGGCAGAAVSVASGIAPLALALEHNGDIRRVSASTGVVGVTPGRAPAWSAMRGAPEILPGISAVGVIGRTARDALRALRLQHPEFAPSNRPRVSLRMVYWSDLGATPVASAVEASMNLAIESLWLMGHEVIPSSVLRSIRHFSRGALEAVHAAGIAALLNKFAAAESRESVEAAVTPAVAQLWRLGSQLGATGLFEAQQCIRAMEAEIRSLFNDVDVILTPTNSALPRQAPTPDASVQDAAADEIDVADFTCIANTCGLPALTLPAPRDPQSGLPIGLHVIGKRGGESVLCDFAAAWEAACPWNSSWDSR